MLNLSDLSRLKGYRFQRSAIGYAAWANQRFALSLRDVEDLLAARSITIFYETIRGWGARFGVEFSANIRRDRPRPADKWCLDEFVVPIKGSKHWLWRAVDANGDVLDILFQSHQNKAATMRFFRKLFKACGQPRVIVTEKLRSYGAAKADLEPGIAHRQLKRLRLHTSIHDGAKRSWIASNHPVNRSGSCRSTTKPPHCFAPNVTVSQPVATATLLPMRLSFGTNMLASWPHSNAPMQNNLIMSAERICIITA